MSSDKEFIEDGESCATSHNSQKKCRIPRRIIWHPASPEKETFRTVVVNYHVGNKNRGSGVMSKKRDTWSQMVAALNAKKERKVKEEEEIYNLRGLYQVSLDELVTTKSATSSTMCEPQTSTIGVPRLCSQKRIPNDESHQNIKVEIYKMPPLHKPESEYYQQSQLSKSDIVCPKSLNSMRSESFKSDTLPYGRRSIKNEPGPPNVKVEIFNLPPVQETKAEVITPKLGHVLAQDAEVIVISDDDEDEELLNNQSNVSVTTGVQPDIVQALKKLAEAAQSTCALCACATKSTQKPEARFEVPTQTVQPVIMEQKLSQIPSLVLPFETQKTTTKTTPAPTFKQRQLELHRLRVLVEQKRLQLLEIKLQREQDEMAHERQLFEKDLEAKRAAFFKSLGSENDA